MKMNELNKFIEKRMSEVRAPIDRLVAIHDLAVGIIQDPDKLFLFLAKSSLNKDELEISQKISEIMANQTKEPSSAGPDDFGGEDFPSWRPVSGDVGPTPDYCNGKGFTDGFDPTAAWIQTYSGRRFNPTKPNPDAIVIQDIAHALSQQCRFSGHCKDFYSVAQHSVLVSHVCNHEDALWGLMHDASEAYLVDVPRPLKKSGKFQAYIDFEDTMQKAICKRFGMPEKEPPSVKRADAILLATEARDLMSPRHPDWVQPIEPLPFKIDPWSPKEAEVRFLERFTTLIGRLI